METVCSVEGCERRAYARTWCNAHYVRWQKYGDVTVDLRARRRGEAKRFWALVEKTETCWIWTGTKSPSGYGKFWTDDGRTARPHRWAYQHEVGPIPAGMTLDHLCHSKDRACPGGPACPHRACVRPDHLEPVTGRVNTGRGGNAQKTHCRKGHPYDEENTYV